MAKKKTGNKFLDTGDYGVKKNKAEKQSSSSSSGKNKVEKATTVKNTNKAVKNYSSTNMGGSQYSVKNASNTKKQEQRTTTPKANTNSVNNTVKNHSTTNMGGSQYSVANKVNKDLEQRRQSELDKNKQKREYTNEQMRNQKSGLDSDKKALDTRMTDLTKGTAKQIAGGHLTSLGHDSNDANEFKKSLDQMVLDGKIDQETADKNYESYLKSNTKANRDQDWKDTKLHKTFQKIEQKGIDLNAKGDAQVQKGMEGLKGGKKLLADAYTSGVGMLSDMAFGPAWAGSMMSRSFGNELNSKRGLVESGIITEKEAENNAGLQALKEVGTEYMFTGFGLAKNLKGVGAFTESLDAMKGKALDNLTSKISNKILKNITYSGLKGLAGSLEEGVEEIAGGILEPRLSNLAYANKVDKRMENSFREGLLANSSDINTQIDYYVSQGYDRDSIVNAYAEQIMGEENYNDMYNSFLESGMSDKQAKKMATAMQNYMVANLNGDKKAMQKAENEMLAKYNDAFSIKEKFSAKDTFEAAASAMIMASLTGGVGNIGTTAKGMIAKQTFSNVEGAMNAASAISNMAMGLSDEKMAARAKAMYESAQNGNDLALEQYAELQDAIQKQTESDAYDSMIAQMTGTNLANKQRYFAKPQVEMAEDGSFNYIGEVTNQRASDIENKVRESFNQYSEAYGDVQSEDASNLASNITAIELGFINAEAVANFTTNHPEARAIYESVAGVTLPETNQATRDFLFKRSAANYENTARLETINTVDSKKGQLDVQYANSFGSEGQEVFQNLSQNIGLENSTDYVAYATAMGKVYDAGVNGLSMEEAMRLAEDGYAISSEDAELMYKAGATDKTIKKSGGTVKYEVSDAAKIKSSEREAFGALARAFNVNIKVTDNLTTGGEVEEDGVKKSVGQQVNGQYDPKTNTITLNLNKDVRVNVGYTLMHEFTHSIKEHFPSEYDQFAKLFKERWENNVGAEEVARIIKAKQDAYKRVANQDLTKDEALEEIICDQMGEVLHDTEFLNKVAEENPNVAQALLYTIRDILRKIRDLFATYGGFPSKYNGAMLSQLDMLKEAETLLSQAMERASEIKTQEVFDRDSGVRDSVDENPIKYSANPYFEHDVDEWETNGMKDGEVFILGSTGDIIQGLGAMEQDIYMLSDKINIILGDHPEMNIDHIKKISDVLERPVLIMKSTNEGSVNTRLTIFGNEKTSTGPMMVVLDLRPKENKVAIEDMQKAVSAYAKNVDKRGKTAKEFIEESEILFVNKKRIARLLSSLGFARPNEVLLSDSIGRITYRKQNVKIEGEEFNNVFNTSTDSDTKRNSIDTEYFDAIDSGDMDKVQRMVDEAAKRNGYTSPLLYHGSEAEFNEFEPNEFITEQNGLSQIKGYFGEDKEYSESYGNVREFYLKNTDNFFAFPEEALPLEEYPKWFEEHGVPGVVLDSSIPRDTLKGYVLEDGSKLYSKWEIIDSYNYWSGDGNLTEKIKEAGFDGIKWKEGFDENATAYMPFNRGDIKSADPITYDDNGNIIPLSERFDETKDDIRWSVDSNEADAQGRTLSQGQAEFYKNVAPELRDEDGNIKRYYHGTQRMDRVGNIFDPARATSGPMAFFTDNPEIAENYSKSKSDTSLKYDDNAYFMYEDQFRTKSEDDEDTMSIIDVWRYLPKSDRDYITERAGHTHYDWDDYETLVYDEETNDAGGGFTWQLKEARGNTLKALVEQWLNSGNLFNEEAKFNDVLDFIGVNEVLKKNGYEEVAYFDPNYTEEGVFEQYLRVENPLVTTNIDEEFVDDLVDWLDATDLTIYERESASTDFWDKNDVDPYDFAERVRDDIEKGTTHAWTSIPDAVTDFLKDQGYDGIVDEGGKHGGLGHQVVIPFSSEQVKDIDNLNPTENPDKRFSLEHDKFEKLITNNAFVLYNNGKPITLQKEIYARAVSNINTEYYYKNKTHEGVQFVDVVTSRSKHYVIAYKDYGFDNYEFIAMFNSSDKLLFEIRSVYGNDRKAEEVDKSISESRNIGDSYYSSSGNFESRSNNHGVSVQIAESGNARREDLRSNSDGDSNGDDTRSVHEQFWREFDEEYGYLIDIMSKEKHPDAKFSVDSEEVKVIKSKSRHSKSDVITLRDAGEKLTEKDFYKLYRSTHTIGIRLKKSNTYESVEGEIKSILENGFEGDGGFGINLSVLNKRGSNRYYTDEELKSEKGWTAADFDKAKNHELRLGTGYEYVDGKLYVDISYGKRKYRIEPGDAVILVPDHFVDESNGAYKIKNGFKPFPYEIVIATDYYQDTLYDLYSVSYEMQNADIRYSVDSEGNELSDQQIKLIDNTEPTSDPDIRLSIPTQDELDDRQMNNPKDDMFLDGDISDEMKARRVKIQDEIAAELAHIIRKDVQYTHGKTLEVKSIKPQITELVRSTMANSENTNKEKRETTKMVMEAAQVLWRRYGTKRDAEGTLNLKRSELAELQRFVMDVSKDVVENTNYIDDSIYNEYQTMRDYIRSIRIEVPDGVKSDIDFAAYRRKNLGRMTLVNEHHGGTAIDVLWDDMKPVIASFVSEEFDLEEIDTQAEMFLAIESALDNTKAYRDAYASEFAQDLEMQFAKDFLNIVLTEGQAWKSFADKKQDYYNERTKQMKARHKEAMREQRMKFQKEIKEVKAEEREKRNIQRMKYLQKEAERKQKAREQRQAKKDHKERMRSWKSIGRNYDALVKKLNHPKKELGANIPEEFREALATVLKSFDLQTENSVKIEFKTGKVAKTTLAMRDLRDALSKIAPEDDSGVFLHNGAMFGAMEILVRDLNDRPLRDLNNSELDEIDVLLASIKHAIDNENKLLVKGQKESQRSAGETIIREFQEKIAKYGRGYNYTGAKGKIHNLLNTSMLTPGAFFKSLGGQMKQMYKNLRYAQDDYIRDVNYLRGFFGDLFKPYQNKKKPGSAIEDWQNDKMAQTITLRNGSVIKMTVAQMMSLYCLSKRPQAMEHMITENGGVGIILADVTSTKGVDKVLGQKQTGTVSATAISYDDVVSIAGMLTKEQKHIADELQKLMNGKLQEWGNETSMQMYGIKLFTEDNYFPIEVSSGHLDSQIGKASGIKGNKISNFGFTKPLVEHPNNPIVIGDIFDIVADHANKMALYHSYAAALTDFNRVLNYKSEENPGVTVKSALQEAYGHDAMSFIDNLLSDINGQAEARMDGVNDLYNTALANYKKAAIGANLRVLVQQPTAIVRSLSMIDAKYFVGIPKNLIKERNEMHEHCPIAAWKAWGNYQNDYTRSLSDIMFNKDWNRFDTVTMGMYGYADDMTWAIIWGAVKNEVKAKHPGVKEGSEEFWILCNERASEVFDDTQVVDSVFHRSDAMRQKGVTKIFTAFMAEPTKTYNMMRSQIVESYRMYQDGDKQGAARGLAKVTTVLILNAAAVSAAAAVIDAMRGKGDDDEDETWVETFLRNFWENFYGLGSNSDPLAMIVFCKDIENLFINAMEGNIFGGTQNMALEGWWKLAQGCAEFKNKVMTGEESFWAWMFGDPEKNTPGKFLSGLGYVTGIPTYTLVKDLKTVLNKFGLQVYAGDETETETKKADKKESRWFDYNRNPIYIQDGSGFDNFLNRFGYNLTEDEKAERQYNKALKDYKKQVKNLSGEEKDKKVRELATSGYKDAITEGDYDTIRRMRQMVSDLGGDVDDFDEKVSKATVTAYKKCIGGDADDTRRMIQMRNYLLDQGWSEYKISSDIVYKSDAAREFKAACRSMDKEKMVETLRPLAAAGLTKDDAYKLYKNRNMGNFDKSTTGKLKWATEGTISSDYGYRNCPYHGYEMHEAIDIAAPLGTTVTASDGGTVIFAGYDGSGYGNYIRVQHANGVITQYSHLDYIDVRKGQNVGQGQYIGNVGSTGNSTGPHLDFRVEVNGQFVNPHDYLS